MKRNALLTAACFGSLLFISACASEPIQLNKLQTPLTQVRWISSEEPLRDRDFDSLREQILTAQLGGPESAMQYKKIMKSRLSERQRSEAIQQLECDPATGTRKIDDPTRAGNSVCYFEGLVNLSRWSSQQFDIKKVPMKPTAIAGLIPELDTERMGNPEEIYEVRLSDGRAAYLLTTSFPSKPLFNTPEDIAASQRRIHRNSAVILLRAISNSQLGSAVEIVRVQFIPEAS